MACASIPEFRSSEDLNKGLFSFKALRCDTFNNMPKTCINNASKKLIYQEWQEFFLEISENPSDPPTFGIFPPICHQLRIGGFINLQTQHDKGYDIGIGIYVPHIYQSF